jgi:hypothetical protein
MTNAMTTILKMTAVALVAVALVAFISACSSSSGDADGAATGGGGDNVEEHVDDAADDHDDGAADHDAADDHGDADDDEGGGTVHVSLNEWSITPAHGEFFEATAGELVFEIHNDGLAPHDFKVIKTDLAPDALPITDGVVDMAAAGEVIGGVDPLPGDIGVEEPYHLETGHYVFLCSIPGHYQQGMTAEMTVQ